MFIPYWGEDVQVCELYDYEVDFFVVRVMARWA